MSIKSNNILASMPLKSSSKSPSNKMTNGRFFDTEGVKIIYTGSTTLWRHRMTIDVIVADHQGFNCLEIIFYNPDKDREHRLYIDKSLLGTKITIPEQEMEAKLTQKIEPFIRQKRESEFDREAAAWDIKHDVMVAYINSRITIPAGLEEDKFNVELKANFGDTLIDRNGTRVLDVVLEQPPEGITALRTKQKRRLSMVEVSSAMQKLASEQVAISKLTSAAVEHVVVARRGSIAVGIGGSLDDGLVMESTLSGTNTPRLEPLESPSHKNHNPGMKLLKKVNSFKAAEDMAHHLCSGILQKPDGIKPRRRGSVITAETVASRQRRSFDEAGGVPIAAAAKASATESNSLSHSASNTNSNNNTATSTATTTTAAAAAVAGSSKVFTASNVPAVRRRTFDGATGVINRQPFQSTKASADQKDKEPAAVKDTLGRAAKQRRYSAGSSRKAGGSKLSAKFENLHEVAKEYEVNGSSALPGDNTKVASSGGTDLESNVGGNGETVSGNNTKKIQTSLSIRRKAGLKSVAEDDAAVGTTARIDEDDDNVSGGGDCDSKTKQTSKD